MTLAVAAPLRPSPPAARPTAPIQRCDLCSIPSNAGTRIIRFSLVVHSRKLGRKSTRGVGTLLLCYRCWRTTAGQRRYMRGPLPPLEP